MLRDRYHPMDLFELVRTFGSHTAPVLTRLDTWNYPGLVDSSSLGSGSFGHCTPFVLAGAQVAQG
jgi:hypothetical protein